VVELLGGRYDDTGSAVRFAELRSLTGEDEAWLASLSPTTPTAQVVTGLLTRCALRLGDRTDLTREDLRGLLVGDRDYLLLALRELTYGSRFNGLLACPACGQAMDLSFEANDIPLQRRPQPQSRYEADVRRRDGGSARVTFHLPTGGDQESLVEDGGADPGRVLLARCLESINGHPPSDEDIDALDPTSIDQLDETIEGSSPNVELSMRLTCPTCDHHFDADYDLVPFLIEEFRLSSAQLSREVHTLAYYYHWSRSDILALTKQQRRDYVSLISDERMLEAQR
jgi:hypothetical protein